MPKSGGGVHIQTQVSKGENKSGRPNLERRLVSKRESRGGREGDTRGKRYGDICICVTDSLCYKAETNKHTIVKQLYSNKNGKKKW